MKTEEIAWWKKFLKSEERYRKKRETNSEATPKTMKASNWPFVRLGKHLFASECDGARSVDAKEQHMEEQVRSLPTAEHLTSFLF